MNETKSKICGKLGINELNLSMSVHQSNTKRGTNYAYANQPSTTKTSKKLDFGSSPKNNFNLLNQSINNFSGTKGNKTLKLLSTTSIKKKSNKPGTNAYQNYKIDIMVPNSEPPKALVTSQCTAPKGSFSHLSHMPTNSIANVFSTLTGPNKNRRIESNLSALNESMKIKNTDSINQINRIKNHIETDHSGKNLYS